MIARLFNLSRKSNGFGTEIEYIVVKDFCLEEGLFYLPIYEILKSINSQVSHK